LASGGRGWTRKADPATDAQLTCQAGARGRERRAACACVGLSAAGWAVWASSPPFEPLSARVGARCRAALDIGRYLARRSLDFSG